MARRHAIWGWLAATVLLPAFISPPVRGDERVSVAAAGRRGKAEFRLPPKGGSVSGSFEAESWLEMREWMPSGTGIWTNWLRLRTKGTFQGTFDVASGRVTGTVTAQGWQYDGVEPTHAQAIRIAKEGLPLADEQIRPMHPSTLRLVERVLKLKTLPTQGKLSGSIRADESRGQISVSFAGDKSGSKRDPFYDAGFYSAHWEFKFDPSGPTEEDAAPEKPKETTKQATHQPPGGTKPGHLAPKPPKSQGKSFVVATLKADKEAYVIGRRVALTLGLERWETIDAPGEAPRSEFREKIPQARFLLDFHFPTDTGQRVTGVAAALSKSQPFIPFAPIVPGKYRVEARLEWPAEYLAMNEAVQGPGARVTAEATFECVPPDAAILATAPARIDKLRAMHKAALPSHRDEVYEEHLRRNPASVRHKLLEGIVWVKPPEIGDMEYGDYNNLYFGSTDTSWVCGSTQSKVLDFLNNVRFSDPDRDLMAGIHDAPIVRGFPMVPGRYFSGGHYGVVVYPHGTAYDNETNRVFDPWPRQMPDDFPLKQFREFYGAFSPVGSEVGVGVDYYTYSRGPFSGYPTHGSFVYWNRNWRVDLKGQEKTAFPAPFAAPPVAVEVPSPVHRVLCKCPVHLLATDAGGRRVGMDGGKLVGEVPGSELSLQEKAEGDYSWYMGLPPGDYRLQVTGTGKETFFLSTSGRDGTVCVYAAATDRGETAELRLADARPGADLVLAGGARVPPRVTKPAASPGAATFTAAQIKRLREQAAEAAQVPEGVPDGWSKGRVDPGKLLAVFAPLRLKQGYALRAYQFKEEGNGNGFVWAMPAEAALPDPDRCPRLMTHFLKPPKPPTALDAMEAVEGDGTPWSYLVASLLAREFKEFGALGHGCEWIVHTVLDDDPWKSPPAGDDPSPLDRPTGKPDEWKWLAEAPKDWKPQVRMEKDRVTVTFYTYSGLQKQAIYRHTDVYTAGSYRSKTDRREIATGPGGIAF